MGKRTVPSTDRADEKLVRLEALQAKVAASLDSGVSDRSISDIIEEGNRIARERGLRS